MALDALAVRLVEVLVDAHGPCDEERVAEVLLNFWDRHGVTTVEDAQHLFDLAKPLLEARLEQHQSGTPTGDSRGRLN